MKGKGIIELENYYSSILNDILVSSCKLKPLLKKVLAMKDVCNNDKVYFH